MIGLLSHCRFANQVKRKRSPGNLLSPLEAQMKDLGAASQTLLGSFSNDDGDVSKNVKKAIGLILYISMPSLYGYDVKMPNFTFYGGPEQAKTNFSFSFQKTGVWSLRHHLQGNLSTFDIFRELE